MPRSLSRNTSAAQDAVSAAAAQSEASPSSTDITPPTKLALCHSALAVDQGLRSSNQPGRPSLATRASFLPSTIVCCPDCSAFRGLAALAVPMPRLGDATDMQFKMARSSVLAYALHQHRDLWRLRLHFVDQSQHERRLDSSEPSSPIGLNLAVLDPFPASRDLAQPLPLDRRGCFVHRSIGDLTYCSVRAAAQYWDRRPTAIHARRPIST